MNKKHAIVNGKIILDNQVLEGSVLIFDRKIIAIDSMENISLNDNIEIIDAEGKYVSPGFIDIHIHGSGGSDVMDGDIGALDTISQSISKKGVTGFLPTTMTMDKASIYKALNIVRYAMNTEISGAKVLGAHIEGPFINAKYKGAQNSNYILKPDFEFVKDYLDIIRIITLAPEMDKGYEFLNNMNKYEDIVLSIGHSKATFEEAMESIKSGIRHATHIFNAMPSLHHREPGVIGAVFRSDITCDLIADKIHVHPSIFQLLIDIKGKDKLILITDSMRAGCVREGEYDLGGQQVIVKYSSARLKDGTLAGSVLTLNEAVRSFLEHTDLQLYEVVALVTKNPAKLIGIEETKGTISIGKDADITVFDEEFDVYLTIVEGRIVFKK